MNGITIVSKIGGVSSSQPWGDIQIGSASSVIKISVSPHDVYQMARSGQDLVITTKTGETITLRGYFNATADGADHDIVFEDGDGVLWLAEYVPSPSSYAFQEIASINELLLTSGGAETAAGWFWPLGALGATSAIWENRGGRDSASRPDKPSARLGRPSPPTEVSINEDGSVITGRGEEGATVIVSDPNGNVIGTGLVGADGSFNLDINPPQNDGETLTVVVRNPEGGQSDPVIITAPGGAEEEQPDDGESEPTPTSESPDGEDGQPDEDENEGTGGEQPDEELPDDDDPDRDGETEEPETEDPDSPVDNEAPDAPVDLAVNADGTVLTGRGEPATRVEVRGPSGNLVGAGSVNTDGSFAVTLQPAQTNGQQLAVTLTDSSNLTSLPALVTAPLVDAPNNDAPDAATNLAITPDGSAVTGRGEPGATITITTPDGAPVGTGTVQSDGTFNVPLTPPQTNGETLAVVLSNGNGSSDPVTITAPVVNLETIPDAAENLAINAAGTVVTGTGKPDSTVEIRDASGTLIGTGDVDAQGDFSVTLQPAKTDGSALTVTLTNSAGSSPATTIQAPKAPDQATDLAISSDGTTLTGKGDPGATVRVHTAANVEVGNNTTVNEDGSFTIPLNPPQTDGGQLGVVLSNATGASPVALVNAPLVDNSTSVPDAPENLAITSDGIRLSGEGEPNAAVIVTNAGVQVGSGIVQGNGSFVITLDAPQIDGGLLSVVLRNGGGNSLPGQISAPKAPDVATNVAITADGEVVTGDGEVNARVEVRTADGQMIGNGTVQPSGSFTVTLTTAQTQGGSLSVVLINATGESPAAPITAPDLSNSGAEPEMATDLAINVTGTILTGKGEPNATVVVRDAGSKEIGTALVSGDGTFTVTLISPQIDGGELSVVVTNPHGNSDPANISAPKVPDPATDLIISADGAILGGNGEPQAKVRVYDDNDQLIGEADVNSNGTFDAVLNSPQAPGEELRVILSNATGQSQPASITVPPFDNTGAPPAMPDNLTITPDGKVLTGTGEAGAVVRVVDINEAEVGRGIVLGDNTFSLVLDPPQIYGDTLAVILSNTVGDSPAGTVDAPKIPDAPQDLAVNDLGTLLTGKGEPNAVVIITDSDDTEVGRGTVDGAGDFSITLVPPQVDGGQLTVVLSNAAGLSPAETVTAPSLPDAPTDLDVAADGASLTGKATTGLDVIVRNAAGEVVGTGTVVSGEFTVALTPVQNDGGTLSVVVKNATGESPAQTITAPKVPDAPSDLALSNDGATLTGKGEVGARVEVRDSTDQVVGDITVTAPDGSFEITFAPPQNQGGTLSVAQSNAAGSSPAVSLAAPKAPDAPVELEITPNGATVSGKGEAGAEVKVYTSANALVGEGWVDSDGTFSIDLTSVQNQGGTLLVTLSNPAGASPAAPLLAPSVPEAPIDLQVSPNGVTLTGKGEADATVEVTSGGAVIGTGFVKPDGTFAIALNPAQIGEQVLTVTLTNPAGTSPGADVTAPFVDLVGPVPDAPQDLAVNDLGTLLTGKGEPNAVVIITDSDDTEVGRGTVDGAGDFSITLVPPQVDGGQLTVVLSNAAGLSPAETVTAPSLPDAPTDLDVAADGASLTGKATTGLDVIVRNAAGEVVGTGTVVSGEFTVALTPVQNDGGTLSVVVKNATGESPAQTITAPKVPDAPSDLALSNDGATLTGKGEVGARVEVRDSTDQVVGDITVTAPDGSFEITFAPPQNQGGTLSVAQSNAAGSSPAVSLAAPKAPDAPVELEITPNGATVSGKGEAGAEVKVYTSANALVGEGWVDSDGTFSIDLTSVQNQGGTLLVTLSNPAGASPAAPLLAPSVPEAPIDLQVSPNGVTLTGKGEANASAQVKNAAGDVVGNTTVNADGTFTVLLNPPQIAGESLSVVLTNAAGSSVPQTVTAPLVEAIEAFDNLVEAHIDLLPAVEQTIDPSAFYGIDIDLLGIDLQLLSRPVISFTVAPGHRSDVELVYDTLAELNLLNDLKIGVQVKNASGQWEAVQGGSGDVSFLELKLLASNAKGATLDSLPAGEYRAFLHSEAGVLSADVVGTLNSSRTIYDYTDIQGVTAVTASGNVLTDTGLDNKIDDITANTIVARVNNTDIPSGGLTINGAYGQLVIQQNGSYTYTPNESANNIGKVDSFTYLIRDTQTGVQDTASLYVRLDSNSADLVWDGPTNSATTGLQAVDDTAMTQLTYGNKVTDPEIANLGSFSVTPILGLPLVNLGQSGAGSASFSVAEDSLADVTFYAVTTGILEVAASFSITVEQRQGSSWVVIDQVSDNGLLTLPLLGQERSGIALTVVGLEAGEYRISATNETLVSLGSSYDVNIFADPLLTHLDEYVAAPHPGVTGNILDGDSLGSMATKLLMNVGGTYTQVTSAGLTLDGAYGSLQVNADGSYVYSPDINRHHLTDVVETFTYALQHPNGEISTATLQITLEVSGAGIASSSFDQFAMGSDMLELDFDLVAGMGDEEVADEPEPDPDLTLGDLIHAPTAEISFASFEEGAQDEWVELSSANLEPAVVSDPFLVESPVHNDDLWNQPENQFG